MLEGARVTLRRKTLGDAPRDYRWQKDAALAALSALPPLKMSFIAFLTTHVARREESPTKIELAITVRASGRHIGNCALYDIDHAASSAQLGVAIGDGSYRGQGYGADTVKTLAAYTFNGLKMMELYLKTLEQNVRAQACFARCGFAPQGMVLERGHYFVLMNLTRSRYLTLAERWAGARSL